MVYRGYTSNILRNLCMHFPHFEPPSVDRAEYRPTYISLNCYWDYYPRCIPFILIPYTFVRGAPDINKLQ